MGREWDVLVGETCASVEHAFGSWGSCFKLKVSILDKIITRQNICENQSPKLNTQGMKCEKQHNEIKK